MQVVPEGQRDRWATKPILAFVTHQLAATFGVIIAAPAVFALSAPVLRLFGWTLYTRDSYRIVTETSYFPVQIGFAFALGWILSHYVERRPMFWVWLLPAVVLLLSVITNYHVLDLGSVLQESQPRLSHFFGDGCRPHNHCFDQMFTTLPSYSAAAYSLGALLAGNRGISARAPRTASRKRASRKNG